MFDTSHPWLRPLWVRVAIVASCAGWTLFEFMRGSPFWGMLFLAAGAVAFHGFFLAKTGDDGDKDD
ncbi:hypothetical protein ACMU_01490 [Actibacterium mucosum KCTC 23349]|uniref:DUF3329 domain-containing protein n=1 Tax=Actibacterium mucosum KCTC 23349 TaxID=1454373 RepID=A0A037ZNR2_9RHOB|nr:hypothetical protein [Actibacterium mucosum]KAJ57193.1 hypothetical protein ACMU_01490 [Actibacterium mucosum KCTC 23349]